MEMEVDVGVDVGVDVDVGADVESNLPKCHLPPLLNRLGRDYFSWMEFIYNIIP